MSDPRLPSTFFVMAAERGSHGLPSGKAILELTHHGCRELGKLPPVEVRLNVTIEMQPVRIDRGPLQHRQG
jgi:hypothetical protein